MTKTEDCGSKDNESDTKNANTSDPNERGLWPLSVAVTYGEDGLSGWWIGNERKSERDVT
jgi:hypothetical protein